MTKAFYRRENFDECGPGHLKKVDWSKADERRSVAASLIKGVKVQEQDGQKRRVGSKAIAPKWWEYFHFQCIQIIVDQVDSSIFGVIFEYKPPENPIQHYHIPSQHMPPKYVIAFRGTLVKWLTLGQDIYNDLTLILDKLCKSPRYQNSLNTVKGFISTVGPENVWLTGHSLGAAIALQIGKTMARERCLLETYLFNPPYCSAPIEKLTDPDLKSGIRTFQSFAKVSFYFAITDSKTRQQYDDSFATLRPWIPYLFVNQNDPVSCEYIGYFEHREKMKKLGMDCVTKTAAQISLRSLILGAFGEHSEPLHLMPSAVLVKRKNAMKEEFKFAHGLYQWWAPQTQCETKRFLLTDTC